MRPPVTNKETGAALAVTCAPSFTMPSLLKWTYLPGIADDEQQPVEQRVYAGDMVIFNGQNSPFFGTEARCDGVVTERGSVVFGCLGVHTHATWA